MHLNSSMVNLRKLKAYFVFCSQGMFKQSKTHFCIRFHYQSEGQKGFLHTFRSMNIRFFNNMAITIRTEEEIAGKLYYYVKC